MLRNYDEWLQLTADGVIISPRTERDELCAIHSLNDAIADDITIATEFGYFVACVIREENLSTQRKWNAQHVVMLSEATGMENFLNLKVTTKCVVCAMPATMEVKSEVKRTIKLIYSRSQRMRINHLCNELHAKPAINPTDSSIVEWPTNSSVSLHEFRIWIMWMHQRAIMEIPRGNFLLFSFVQQSKLSSA